MILLPIAVIQVEPVWRCVAFLMAAGLVFKYMFTPRPSKGCISEATSYRLARGETEENWVNKNGERLHFSIDSDLCKLKTRMK